MMFKWFVYYWLVPWSPWLSESQVALQWAQVLLRGSHLGMFHCFIPGFRCFIPAQNSPFHKSFPP